MFGKKDSMALLFFLTISFANCNTPNSGKPDPEVEPVPESLPVVETKSGNGYYPDSNESGQLRLDIDLDASSRLAIDVPENQTPTPLTYRIMGPVKGLTIQAEGEPAIGDLDGLIAHITRDAKTDREKADALFFFIKNEMKDWYYPAQGIDLTVEQLSVLIWNFGYGFCYDLGRLQAGLWARAGLRSRIVGWPQHTVAEVFYDDAWHLYDLQHRSFYEKEDGQVAGFDELQADGNLFYQGLNKYGLDNIGYPPHHMVHWYGIAKPNFQDSQEKDHWKTTKTFDMDLRVGEMFEILYTQPGVMYHPDSWSQYYGEMTLRKDPPWPIQARLSYVPSYINLPAVWEKVETPSGMKGFALEMNNPFIFTEGWIKIPGLSGFAPYWIETKGRTDFVGRLVGGNGIFTKYIAGGNHFKIIVQMDGEGENPEDFGLDKAEIHTRLQMSHLGVPKLNPGRNLWPVRFESGRPHVTLWYKASSADLNIVDFRVEPENPKPGQSTSLIYTIENSGSFANKPTSLTVYNNTTAFMSETIEKVGVHTVPPIAPGQRLEVSFYWSANTRMTWYGQNPYVQLMDAWLDIEKDRADPNRDNNRSQDYILLSKEDGQLPELPGYGKLPGTH